MATFGDLKKYVEKDGWTEEKNRARRRYRVGDHWRYSKEWLNGPTLRTKVSHSVRDEIGADLFHRILREQLRVDEATFWAVVHERTAPETSAALTPAPLPGWLIQRLIFTMGMPEDQVRNLSAEDAAAAWEAYQTDEK